MGFGYAVDFLDDAGTVIESIPDSTGIKQLNLGGVDTGSMERFDSYTHLVRRGDNLVTPAAYIIEAIISETSLATLRAKLNNIKSALYSATKVKVYDKSVYVFSLLPSEVALSHGITIHRMYQNTVKIVIYINSATSIADYTPPAPPNELIEGYAIWLNASEGTYKDAGLTLAAHGETVQEWHDQSENDYHAVQTTASNRPTFSTEHGFPSVAFPSNQWFTIPNYFWGGGTIFIVCKSWEMSRTIYRSLMGYQHLGSIYSTRYMRSSNNVGRMEAGVVDGWFADDFQIYGDFYVHCITFDVTNGLKLYIDDILVATDPTGTSVDAVNASVPMLLGALYYNTTAVDKFFGHITDVVMYDTVLDVLQLQQCVSFLKNKDSAVRVPQVPAGVTGVGLWLAGDELTYKDETTFALNDEAVQLWKDKAGHKNAYQSAAISKPTLKLEDNILALYFDGNDYLYHTYFGELGTCFVVGKLTSNSNFYRSFLGAYGGSTSANIYLRPVDNSGNIACALADVPAVTTAKIYNEWYLLSMRFDNATGIEMSVNGIVVAQGGTGTRTPVPQDGKNPPMIGATYYSDTVVDYHLGYIAEVIIYPNKLNDTDYNTVISYLKNKYPVTQNITAPYSANLQTHWDSTQGVYKDAGVTIASVGDNIQQWNDLSGNGYYATQTTVTDQPTLSNVDGINVVSFDGIDSWLQHSYLGEPATVYIVLKGTNATLKYEMVLGAGSASHNWSWLLPITRPEGLDYMFARNTLSWNVTPRINNTWNLVTTTYNSTSKARSISVDGVLKDTLTTTGIIADLATLATIGCYPESGTPAGFYKGYIAEILIYDVEHTALQQLEMWNYLKNKWSVL